VLLTNLNLKVEYLRQSHKMSPASAWITENLSEALTRTSLYEECESNLVNEVARARPSAEIEALKNYRQWNYTEWAASNREKGNLTNALLLLLRGYEIAGPLSAYTLQNIHLQGCVYYDFKNYEKAKQCFGLYSRSQT